MLHFSRRPTTPIRYVPHRNIWQKLHVDLALSCSVFILIGIGLLVLYSAGNQSIELLFSQITHIIIALVFMILFAQITPNKYKSWAPWLFGLSVFLLLAVLLVGKVGKGAQRWLDFGIFRFQPSEVAKLGVPMFLAWYYDEHHLPPFVKETLIGIILLIIPVLLIAKQPDLGTAIIIAFAGGTVILLAGINWRFICAAVAMFIASLPIIWHYMHDFQRERVLTFLNPERDPIGTGYHIIQSKIAIGSGGIFGKGWLNGSQSHLHFLPEHSTDFIFAVICEEFGLLGCVVLITLYLIIIARCLYISSQAQDTFTRLLAGSISLTFFMCVFVNMGMVSGILPVVGVPLPLISYGGTSVVTTIISFGILMSINTHRRLLA